MIGNRYGKLIVESKYGIKNKRNHFNCLCDCGKRTVVGISQLRNGRSTSCGCSRGRKDGHMMSKTRLYKIWKGINKRCKHDRFDRYKGRNISVCQEWLDDSKAFISWALQNGYDDSLQIDRINNDGNYEPLNCRWVTAMENARNRSNNHILVYDEKEFTISELSELFGIKYGTLFMRIKRGWTVAEALFGKKPEIVTID